MSSSSKLIAGTAVLAVVAAGGAAFAAVRLSESAGSTAEPALTAPYGGGIAGAGLGGGRLGGRGFGGGLGPGPHRSFHPGFGDHFFGGVSTVASSYLGLSAVALQTDLQRGETLAQIAKAQGKSVAGLIGVMLADQKQRIDNAVSRGFLSQSEAQQIETDLQQNISDMVNGVHLPRGPQAPSSLPAATA